MARITQSWPYLAGVVSLYLVWLLLAIVPVGLSTDDRQNLMFVFGSLVAPFVIAGAGAVLGYRRGYDWVTVVSCLVLFVAIAVLGDWLGLGQVPSWISIGAAALVYTAVGHVGILAAMGMKRLDSATGR
ncbi:MAG TPA: hypothetical protein DCM67_06440 [Propionibacteriaceae bacterium]|nr:hypothetical protein [Propionibacteriaceae bacterium]